MFALNDIVTWTHPRTGNTHTGVIVQSYGNGRHVVQVWRQWAHVPPKSEVAEETALTDKK